MPTKVVFLDRDGVINRDSPDYIKDWESFEFLPGSLDALAMLTRNKADVIVVTNQSIIGRGMIPPETLLRTHRLMREAVSSHGGFIKDILVCPHRPDDRCACRKPAPGLLLAARDRYGIDLSRAVMVGDSAKDIECARNAGVGKAVLVKTGNGIEAFAALTAKGIAIDYLAEDLLDAVNWIFGSPP